MATPLKRLTDHIVYLPADDSTDRPILAAISGSKRTLLVDAGNSPAHAMLFRNELERAQLPTGDFVALTHWHWDHTFGLSALGIPSIAHIETRNHLERLLPYTWDDAALDQRVAEGIEVPSCAKDIKNEYTNRDDIRIVLPNITFESHTYLDLGGIHCMIEHVGGDHTADSTVIFVEEDKTLFLGDCLGPAIYAPQHYYQRDALIALLDDIELYGAEIYVESHWHPEARAAYLQEAMRLRTIAESMARYRGDDEALDRKLITRLGRELNNDDRETITYLKHGLAMR